MSRDKPPGSKDQAATQHEEWMRTGGARAVKVAPPQTFRNLKTGGLYFIDDDGNFWDGHVKCKDVDGVARYGDTRSGLQNFFHFIRRGAAGVLRALSHPGLGLIAQIAGEGVKLERAKAAVDQAVSVVERFKSVGVEDHILALIDEHGSDRLRELGEEYDKRIADGELSAEDDIALLLIAAGREPPP